MNRSEVLNRIEIELASLADDFIEKHKELGMKATGDWIDSVEVVVDSFSGYILANDYTVQLVQGRAPGNQPPVSPLIEWAKAKFGAQDKEAVSIAWAVATKIKNEGTNYYPDGTDLVDSVLTEDRYNEMIEGISEEVVFSVSSELIREYQNI